MILLGQREDPGLSSMAVPYWLVLGKEAGDLTCGTEKYSGG